MGSALGGGAAEQALGADANNVLTKLTIRGTIVFFVLAFGLYMATQYVNSQENQGSDPNSLIEGLEDTTTEDTSEKNEYPDLESPSADLATDIAQQLESSINKAVEEAPQETEKVEETTQEIKTEVEAKVKEAAETTKDLK